MPSAEIVNTTALPATFAGIGKLTCATPGGPEALCALTVCPPIVAVTAASAGIPVALRVRLLPGAAGRAALLIEPSWFNATACPEPLPSTVKIAGAALATGVETDALD
jgi:hypothetical protein